jgi:hypothetical protein
MYVAVNAVIAGSVPEEFSAEANLLAEDVVYALESIL